MRITVRGYFSNCGLILASSEGMPRKLLFRTTDFPYHITARSNNMEWFYLPKSEVWPIFVQTIETVEDRYGFLLHAFVLMSNHYHMLCTAPVRDIGVCMNYLMREVSKKIGTKSGRKNRIFGARYHWSVIDNPTYLCHAYKYVMRNPVEAGMANRVEDYPFSTLIDEVGEKSSRSCPPLASHRFQRALPKTVDRRLEWLNTPFETRKHELVRRALRRTRFRFTKDKVDRSHVNTLELGRV